MLWIECAVVTVVVLLFGYMVYLNVECTATLKQLQHAIALKELAFMLLDANLEQQAKERTEWEEKHNRSMEELRVQERVLEAAQRQLEQQQADLDRREQTLQDERNKVAVLRLLVGNLDTIHPRILISAYRVNSNSIHPCIVVCVSISQLTIESVSVESAQFSITLLNCIFVMRCDML